MGEKLELTFEECPHCGCEERVGDLVLPDKPGLKVTVIPVSTSTVMGVTVPAVMIWSDFCTSCGREYNTHIEKQMVPVQYQIPGHIPGQGQG